MKTFLWYLLFYCWAPLLPADQCYKVIVQERITDNNTSEMVKQLLVNIFQKTYEVMEDKKLVAFHRYAKKISFDQEHLLINIPESNNVDQFLKIFKEEAKKKGVAVSLIRFNKTDHELPAGKLSEQVLLWHHTVKTTGLYKPNNQDKASCYLPHQFSLWQLAPQKGKGVTIALIDTGFIFPENVCTKHHNDLLHTYKTDKNYNFSNTNPYEKLIIFIKNILKNHQSLATFDIKQLETVCIESIYDYLETKKIDKLVAYFNQCNCIIENQTKKALKKHLDQFNILVVNAGSKDEKRFLRELLPITVIDGLKKNTELAHGSYVASIATQIAPGASILMIKAFDQEGHATRSSIIQALNATLEHRPLIINISYKLSDFIDPASSYAITLQALIDLIPYCVASSGNDGHTGLYDQGYPARFESVAFDVGAFAYNQSRNTYPIPSFSQYQLDKGFCSGPKFLAPGYNIVCSDYQTKNLMQGTSMAAPIISGFVALMLAEFPDNEDFTREHLLKVCYSSGVFLADNADWKTKSVFGALDFRTVLFILHVLRTFKKGSIETHGIFLNQFDQLVSAINKLLQTMATATKSTSHTDEIFKDPAEAITFVANCLLFITNQSTNKPVQLSSSLIKLMKESMKHPHDLFNQYSCVVQKKIQHVLSCNNKVSKSDRMIKNYLGACEFSKFLNNVLWYETYWNQQISKKGKVHL